MTETEAASPVAVAQPEPKRQRRRALGPAGVIVRARVTPLQLMLLSGGNDARARASLAVLRQAASREPGEVPAAWDLTHVPDVPDGAGDAPTWKEVAVHTAMTLYAVHQQSRTVPMDVPGVGLGWAAHELVGRGEEENSSARARFNALVTSSSVSELRRHLRTLGSLLRAREIPLDHAMLADDVAQFQRPGGARAVQLRWARQYYNVTGPVRDEGKSATTTATVREN